VGINVSEDYTTTAFSTEVGQVLKVADYMQKKSVTILCELRRTSADVYCHDTLLNYSMTSGD
jgi:hypothetical protein